MEKTRNPTLFTRWLDGRNMSLRCCSSERESERVAVVGRRTSEKHKPASIIHQLHDGEKNISFIIMSFKYFNSHRLQFHYSKYSH